MGRNKHLNVIVLFVATCTSLVMTQSTTTKAGTFIAPCSLDMTKPAHPDRWAIDCTEDFGVCLAAIERAAAFGDCNCGVLRSNCCAAFPRFLAEL